MTGEVALPAGKHGMNPAAALPAWVVVAAVVVAAAVAAAVVVMIAFSPAASVTPVSVVPVFEMPVFDRPVFDRPDAEIGIPFEPDALPCGEIAAYDPLPASWLHRAAMNRYPGDADPYQD